MQRDSYLPLRVIRERLADGGRGRRGRAGAAGRLRRRPRPDRRDDMTRRQLLDAAEISDAELTELEDYGLIRRVGRQYGPDALAVARAVAALRQYGVQARHLRAVKAGRRPGGQPGRAGGRAAAAAARPGRAGRGRPDGLADRRPYLAAARDAGRVRARRGRAGGRARCAPASTSVEAGPDPGTIRRCAEPRPGGCARPPGDYGCTLAKGEVASRGSPRHVRTEL